MFLILAPELREFFQSSPFESVARLEGTTYRDKEGRRTFKTRLGQKNYFVKYHRGIGWKEIFKESTQLRLPIVSAYNEYKAINKLQQLGIQTTRPVGIGVRGINPAKRESFLITEALEDTQTLQDLTESWPQQRPSFAFKLALIQEVARIVRLMHGEGINHRDLYICHFRIPREQALRQPRAGISLHLMDLHRAQMRRRVPRRWLVKDLGALLFSTADIGLTRTDYLRFLRYYSQKPLRQTLTENQSLWRQVYRRAERFYEREWKRSMRPIFRDFS